MWIIYLKRDKFPLHLQVNGSCTIFAYLCQFFQSYNILSLRFLVEDELYIKPRNRCHNSWSKLTSQLKGIWIYQQICVDKFVCFHSFGKMPACLNKKPKSRHIFVDLHIFVDFAFFPKNIALPRANSQSKRMETAHFCSGWRVGAG